MSLSDLARATVAPSRIKAGGEGAKGSEKPDSREDERMKGRTAKRSTREGKNWQCAVCVCVRVVDPWAEEGKGEGSGGEEMCCCFGRLIFLDFFSPGLFQVGCPDLPEDLALESPPRLGTVCAASQPQSRPSDSWYGFFPPSPNTVYFLGIGGQDEWALGACVFLLVPD